MFKTLELDYEEMTTKFDTYIWGKVGYLLCDDVSMSDAHQIESFHQHCVNASVPTKGAPPTAFVKIDILFEELRATVH
ncbi:hypothetical protein PR001_g20079 [Phytophthora rubi]|uniref:Uncharacterized protein n=1 Tax=Phytophthora rubi TaxID=129364 RepID=A0A6A3JT38_9STRA|nr:hypothetical protein PR001_g20079 [Phytophthora rubi]